MDYQHQPIMIQNTDDVTEFEIMVDYNWFGSPRRDFTVKVYALDVSDIRDEDGDTNMLHTDGQSPSEFNYVEDEWPEGRDASEPETPVIFNRFLDGYTGCKDTNIDATDSYGDDCKWYVVDTFCGQFDDSDFEANELCCGCGGGCYDSADGLTDQNGFGCEYYNAIPYMCGEYDTSNFAAADLCCACQTFTAFVRPLPNQEPEVIEEVVEEIGYQQFSELQEAMTTLQASYPDLEVSEINLDILEDTLGESTTVEAYAGNQFGLLFYSRQSEAFDIELSLHSDSTLLSWMEPTHAYRL